MVVSLLVIMTSCRIGEKDRFYKARRDIDNLAEEDDNDNKDVNSDEILLILRNIHEEINLVKSNVGSLADSITLKTTDTLINSLDDNIHFLKILCKDSGKYDLLKESWLSDVEEELLLRKTPNEYIEALIEIENDILEIEKSLKVK